ncbi:secreted RxLR effector protein 161-like [Solenopsis invicta]|uniref:secreted RxLR effector protein 161-like n=1 Tax=Solenopsis invicta TaxID=13686 RepID=UPI00193D530E|nr:secreted RxLR effector protein 161-like [Solenopsis invicta]
MYLAVCTRPDIAYAVNYLSQYNNCFQKEHWIAAKRILRYLKGTSNHGLTYQKTGRPLSSYVDADWANDRIDRKSYTGSAFILSNGAISWESRKQRSVALSSTEAEYMSLTDAAKEGIHLIGFLKELGLENLANVQMFNDNQSAAKLAHNPIYHARSKHIDVRFHFIREVLRCQPIKLEYLPTDLMIADVLTKPLSYAKHEKFRKGLGVNIPDNQRSD